MTQRTPGPYSQFAPEIRGEQDPTYRSVKGGSGCFSFDRGFELTGFISEADAMVLAASAEMLEALESIVGEAAFEGLPESKQEQIYAAIGKATVTDVQQPA